MELTSGERIQLTRVEDRLKELRAYLVEHQPPSAESSLPEWFAFLAAMKQIAGNSSNDLSLVATLMAKEYLSSRHQLIAFDASTKPQSAPGLDIDTLTVDGARVVGEIKTTVPYLGTKLGGNQKTNFAKDLASLRYAEAEYKYFFVTDRASFDVVGRKYTVELAGVTVVLLPSHDELRAGTQPRAV